jgi:hemolysin activation/secretion protein
MYTVRGYLEREALGDNGVSGTLELRTPLTGGLLRFSRAKAGGALDRMQFLVFADAGYVEREDALPNEEGPVTLFSAGAGLRWSIAERAQIRFDVGVPIVETTVESVPDEETVISSSEKPGYHVSVRFQF